jgi:lysophospholipase L1-like esterase
MELQDVGTIVFTGDSVTDRGRRADPRGIGRGYVRMIEQELGEPSPRIVNTGLSGDRLVDLERRWPNDVVAHHAGLVSVLIGINDTWRRFDRGMPSPVPEFEARYDRLLTTLDGPRLVLVEPFVLPVSPDQESWRPDVEERIAVVHRLAARHGAVLVTADRELRKRAEEVGAATLAADGVHPTDEGHRALAEVWLESVRTASPA